MAITSAAAMTSSTGTGSTSLGVTATATGDLWIVCVIVKSASVTTTGVSSFLSGTWTNVTGNWLDGTGTANESIWIGQMNNSGADTLNFTYSGSVAAVSIDLIAHPFHSSLGSVWTVDGVGGFLSNASSVTVSFPTLVPTINTVSGEVYWGHGRVPGSAGTPTPAGFVTNSDANGNPEMYGVAVTSSVSPTLTQTAGVSNTIAVLVSETSAVTPPVKLRPVLRRTGPAARRRPVAVWPPTNASSPATPSATVAAGSASAFAPSPSVSVNAGVAAVLAVAFGPSVTDQPSPAAALGTAAAFAPSPSITVMPSTASVVASAFGATAMVGVMATAGVATVVAAASAPSLAVMAVAGAATAQAVAVTPTVAVTLVTPSGRICVVSAESRVYVVPAESRVYAIPFEDRETTVAPD